MSPRALFVVLAVALTATPAVAQERERVEIGGFGRYTFFDDSWLYDNAFGGGGRLGMFIKPWLLVEADATSTSTVGWADDQIRYFPFHVYLIYNKPVGRLIDIRFGAGYVHNEYDQRRPGADNGLAGLFALQVWLFDLMALRLDGTADYIWVTANGADDNWHFGLQAGLTFAIGRIGGPPSPQPPVVPGAAAEPPLATPPPPTEEAEAQEPAESADVRAAPIEPEIAAEREAVAPDTARSVAAGRTESADLNAPTVAAVRARRGGRHASFARRLPAAGESVVLEGVGFASGTAALTPGSSEVLDRVASAILATRIALFEIGGYTDGSGPRDLNVRLSLARANAVRRYLIRRGVNADRLIVWGYGPVDPVASNATAEGRARNRRVELRRLH